MGTLKLFCVIDSKSLVKHGTSRDAYQVPYLASGAAQPIELVCLTVNPTGGTAAPWTRSAVGSYAPKIGLFKTSDRSQLSLQDAWTDDAVENKKSCELSLATSEINTALLSANELACTLELQVNGVVVWRQAVTLYKALITAAAVVPAAEEEAATKNWVKGLFVPQEGLANQGRIVVSASGYRFLERMGDDGVMQYDRIPA